MLSENTPSISGKVERVARQLAVSPALLKKRDLEKKQRKSNALLSFSFTYLCARATVSITHNAGVKEFCGVARLSAANKKRDKGVDVLSPSKSPASSTSKMSIASPRTPSTTTGRTMTLSTPKSRKRSTVDSPSREAVATTPSSRQKTSAASTTPASKKRKTESTPTRSPASVVAPNSGRRSGRSSLATAGVTSPLAKGLESSRRSARAKVAAADVGNKSAKVKAVEVNEAKVLQAAASDEGMDLVAEVESGAAVEGTDVETTEGPEGVGMFGRIVRWFGFGQ